MEINNPNLPPQLQPNKQSGPLSMFKTRYQDFLVLAQKNPQLMILIAKAKTFWTQFGFHVKLSLAVFAILLLVIFGLRFGSNLSRIFRPAPAEPTAIPNVTPVPTVKISSDLEKIRNEIQDFSILLPDPAPPPVDPNIYLQELLVEG